MSDDALASGGAPGWYGKLPSTGDFASRRLPHELIEAWDGWLAEELAELRQQHPDDWLQAYLDSPTWRFVLGAGVLGSAQPQPMAGVLMPSVDRVGRYFPLSIMAPLASLPSQAEPCGQLLGWLHALDDIAADALQEDWPIDELEAALQRQPAPHWATTPPALHDALASLSQGQVAIINLPMPEARQAMGQQLGQALWNWGLHGGHTGVLARQMQPGLAWWWCEPATGGPARSLLSRGLPSGHDFHALMGPQASGLATSPTGVAPSDLRDTAPSDPTGA